MANGRYIRVYLSLADEYPELWDNPALLGRYVRLLAEAESWWPTKPRLKGRRELIQPLISLGLCTLDAQDRYSIRGLDAERTRRSERGRHAASMRYAYAEHAGSTATSMPSKSISRRRAEEEGRAVRDALPATGLSTEEERPTDPSNGQPKAIDPAERRATLEATIDQMAALLADPATSEIGRITAEKMMEKATDALDAMDAASG